jgi:cell division inhibitor SulA/protein ImuA
MNLDTLLNRTDVWRGGDVAPVVSDGIPTGFRELDALLPGGGWPRGALTEILTRHEGVGALRLALPALARMSHSQRWLAWVAPPHIPYAPSLVAAGVELSRLLLVYPRATSDTLWALEQAMRSGTCGAVLAWLEGSDTTTLRRLQLAAREGNCWGLLFRPWQAARQPSPAALRLQVEARRRGGLTINILKQRGGWPGGPVTLGAEHALVVPPSAPPAPGSLHPGH